MAKVKFTPALRRHIDCPPRAAEGRSVREVLDVVFAGNPAPATTCSTTSRLRSSPMSGTAVVPATAARAGTPSRQNLPPIHCVRFSAQGSGI